MKAILAPFLALGVLVAAARPAAAQALSLWSPEQLTEPPRLPLRAGLLDTRDTAPAGSASRTPRLQLLGMQSGFLTNPLGIDPDDDPPGLAPEPSRSDPDFVQLNVGTVNPYFDLRLPGDPGGLGYYLVHSQVQLLDAGPTSLCLGMQAYTPAGLQSGGLANGPTYLLPALACFHDLGNGTALQGYFGQNIQANSHWTDRMSGGFHYGMALQCPVPGTIPTSEQGVFLYVQALGRYRYDTPAAATPGPLPGVTGSHTVLWEFVPGVHLRLNNTCWMSVGASRYNFLSATLKY